MESVQSVIKYADHIFVFLSNYVYINEINYDFLAIIFFSLSNILNKFESCQKNSNSYLFSLTAYFKYCFKIRCVKKHCNHKLRWNNDYDITLQRVIRLMNRKTLIYLDVKHFAHLNINL